MNNELPENLKSPLIDINVHQPACELDAEGHCITCSDEAVPVKVLSVDLETGLALVEAKDITEEIDITLIENVAPGDWLLAHGGVAIGEYTQEIPDEANDA